MPVEIVKVQVPLVQFGAEQTGLALIYAKHHRNMVEQPIDEAIRAALGREVRRFCEAEWNADDKRWTIGKAVASQSW